MPLVKGSSMRQPRARQPRPGQEGGCASQGTEAAHEEQGRHDIDGPHSLAEGLEGLQPAGKVERLGNVRRSNEQIEAERQGQDRRDHKTSGEDHQELAKGTSDLGSWQRLQVRRCAGFVGRMDHKHDVVAPVQPLGVIGTASP